MGKQARARMAFDVQTEHRKKAKQQGSREGHGEHLGD